MFLSYAQVKIFAVHKDCIECGGGKGVHDSGDHFNPHFQYLRLNCQGYSRSEYQTGMFGGEGAASMKHEAQGHAQFLNVLQI